MSKTTFSLQAAQFSDSDSQTPMQTIINSYDRQYSLIYQEIRSFLKQCKENINKYIQLNQFGVKFNMYALFVQMSSMQSSTLNCISDVRKQQLQHENNLKNKYEKEFENLLGRMQNVIKDFLKFEVDFKRQYFGWNIAQPQFKSRTSNKLNENKTFQTSILGKLSSQHSIKSSNKSGQSLRIKPPSITLQDEKKETQVEQKLREILKRKLAPQKENIIKFCDKQTDPFRNMLKLEQKIDMMQSQLILTRTREEKIIDIFNKRRTDNLQLKGQNLIHSQLIETDDGTKRKENHTTDFNSKTKAKKENSHDGYDSNNKSPKKLQVYSKPSLNIELINGKDSIIESGFVSSNSIPQNNLPSTRRLISPKGLKSPLQKGYGNKMSFFGSPKNVLGKSKSPVDFKKKKQPQDQQTHSSLQKNVSLLNQGEQIVRLKNNQNQNNQNLNGGTYLNLSGTSNNREQFLLRRKNNISQGTHLGASNLIE